MTDTSSEPNLTFTLNKDMSIFVIYAHKPISAPRTTIDIAEHFDFRFDSLTNRIVLTGKDNGPAIDFRTLAANLEIMNYDIGHLTIDTPVFMNWVQDFMVFRDILNSRHSDARGFRAFHDLLRAIGTFMTCDNCMTNKIAEDFTKWRETAEDYGTGNFINGYRHLHHAYATASGNGAVWIKHFPTHRATE